ncbi:MAG: sensor histidine kinase [Actinomycetota bacterium]
MNESPAPTVRRVQVATSLAVSIAAVIAIFGEPDHTSWITLVFTFVGLMPWVLEARGTRLHPMLFLLMTMLPAAAVVLFDKNPGGLFPAYIAVVWITQRTTSWVTVAVSLAATTGMTIGYGIVETAEFEGTVYFLGGIGVALFAGLLLRRQERLLDELHGATERERVHAASEERTRIAREVHDVIAHSLTVTILHVTGARRALANDPQRAAEALERAEVVGRESLDSIRQVVGLLREVDGNPVPLEHTGDAPLPLLSNIPLLIDQYRAAGLEIEDHIDLEGVAADAMTSLTVFRLAQEGMTNVLRHAPGASVSLRIHPSADHSGIHVRVENPLCDVTVRRQQKGAQGMGLAGMAERVRACGGSIEIGPTESATWLIDVQLPLDHAMELR